MVTRPTIMTPATRAFQDQAQMRPVSVDSELCIQLYAVIVSYVHD